MEKMQTSESAFFDIQIFFRDQMLKLGSQERILNLYKIQDKLSRKAVFFVPNYGQQKYLKNKGRHNIILKCRQVGFTTLSCVRALDLVLWEANTRTGILSHRKTLVDTIFTDITKFCYDNFLETWGHLYTPTEISSAANCLSFKDDGLGRKLNSSIRIMFDFRGKTINYLHVSEASRVESKRLSGSISSVPDNGEVTLESTAFGRGGAFYNFWKLWKAMGVSAPYKGHFIPWFEQYPEVPEDWYTNDKVEYTLKEIQLIKDYNLESYHILWRRWCIEFKCNGDEQEFETEYPTNDRDCFYSGGSNVFPSNVIRMQEKFTRVPIQVGFLVKEDKKIKLIDDEKEGIVTLWNKLDVSHTYVIGADPAGGVGGDYACAYIKDQITKKYVGRIYGQIEPKDFANVLYLLAKMFGNAWICFEYNNHGHTVHHVLREEIKYPNLYRRKVFDEVTQKTTHKIGFVTTNSNKILLTDNFKNNCRSGDSILQDEGLVDEMTTFIQSSSPKGRTVVRAAADGSYDDKVMAACFTDEMDRCRPIVKDWEEQYVSEQEIDQETGFPM